MYKRLNELNFVIGIFFTIVSLILLGDSLFGTEPAGRVNIYTGVAFLVFGIVMILIKDKTNEG